MPRFKFVVLSSPAEGAEEEYNRWYSNQHIPDVLAVDGVIAAERAHLVSSNETMLQRYMAIYEIQSNDVAATLAAIRARWGSERMPMSDALDRSSVTTMTYEIIEPGREHAVPGSPP